MCLDKNLERTEARKFGHRFFTYENPRHVVKNRLNYNCTFINESSLLCICEKFTKLISTRYRRSSHDLSASLHFLSCRCQHFHSSLLSIDLALSRQHRPFVHSFLSNSFFSAFPSYLSTVENRDIMFKRVFTSTAKNFAKRTPFVASQARGFASVAAPVLAMGGATAFASQVNWCGLGRYFGFVSFRWSVSRAASESVELKVDLTTSHSRSRHTSTLQTHDTHDTHYIHSTPTPTTVSTKSTTRPSEPPSPRSSMTRTGTMAPGVLCSFALRGIAPVPMTRTMARVVPTTAL